MDKVISYTQLAGAFWPRTFVTNFTKLIISFRVLRKVLWFEALSTRSVKITVFAGFDIQLAKRCQLYIKPLLRYILKMASWERRYCRCCGKLIKYTWYSKAVLDYKLICSINYQTVSHYMWENRAVKTFVKYWHFEICDFWRNLIQFILNMFHIPCIN